MCAAAHIRDLEREGTCPADRDWFSLENSMRILRRLARLHMRTYKIQSRTTILGSSA